MTPELGRCVVGNKERVGFYCVGRQSAKVVTPQPQLATSAQFPGNQTNRNRALSWRRLELEICEPDCAKPVQERAHCSSYPSVKSPRATFASPGDPAR